MLGPQEMFSPTSHFLPQGDTAGWQSHWNACSAPSLGTLGQRTKDAGSCQIDRETLSPGALTSPAEPLFTVKEIGFKGR